MELPKWIADIEAWFAPKHDSEHGYGYVEGSLDRPLAVNLIEHIKELRDQAERIIITNGGFRHAEIRAMGWLLSRQESPRDADEQTEDYVRVDSTHACGTSGLSCDIIVTPIKLVDVFGQPDCGDGHKVSGEYVFKSKQGDIFTVYDWKATTLYDAEAVMRPSELWVNNKPFPFHVGSNLRDGDPGVAEFRAWINGKLNAPGGNR